MKSVSEHPKYFIFQQKKIIYFLGLDKNQTKIRQNQN